MDAENACADEKEREGTIKVKRKGDGVLSRCVERFHYCDDSRVNFSREIELPSPDAVKRRPMSGERLQLHITRQFLSRWPLSSEFTTCDKSVQPRLFLSRYEVHITRISATIWPVGRRQSPEAYKIINCATSFERYSLITNR